MVQMLQDFSLQLPGNINLWILLSNKRAIHPLLPKMRLLKKSREDCINYHRVMDTYHKSKHKTILKNWKQYALSRNEDFIDTSVESWLWFVHRIHTKYCLYSGVCGASNALSSVVCIKKFSKLSNHPMISRYQKGIFWWSLPKYMQMWKTNEALDYYTNLPDIKKLEFKYFVKKLVMLFLLLVLVGNKHFSL